MVSAETETTPKVKKWLSAETEAEAESSTKLSAEAETERYTTQAYSVQNLKTMLWKNDAMKIQHYQQYIYN